MTAKQTISLTDQSYAFARSLVERGRFPSVSAVLQHGLHLVEREEQEHQARLDAIRADLDRRAAQPSLSLEETDARLEAWRAARDAGETPDLA
jgi:antitoxin ParD1/3/4